LGLFIRFSHTELSILLLTIFLPAFSDSVQEQGKIPTMRDESTGKAIGRIGTVDSAQMLIREVFRLDSRGPIIFFSILGGGVAGRIFWTSRHRIWRSLKFFQQYFTKEKR